MNISYPRIDDAMLIPFRAIDALLKKHPDLLSRPECPYPASVREFLAARLAGGGSTTKDHYDDDDLEREIAELYTELKSVGLRVTGVDAKEKAQVMKTFADLLTKMVALRERVVNIRQMSTFQKTVIHILENIFTPDQRGDFLEQLHAYLPGERAEVLGQGDLGDPASAEGEGPGA